MKKNKLLQLLLSVVVAFALWLYVITVVSPGSTETYYNIPVNLRGESILNQRGLMVISEEAPTVNMELSGNRTELNKITKDNITLVADLSAIYEPGVQTLSYSHAFPGNVADDAITVLDRSPGQIMLTIERMVTKKVPIVLDYQGTLADDYIADKENVILTDMNSGVLESNTIDVTGPESVMKQITQAVITVVLTDRSESFSEAYRYTLCDDAGEPVDAEYVTTNVGEINLTLYIQRVKEIPLRVEVINGGGATEETSDIVYAHETIKVSGTDSVLQSLEELVLGTVDLGELAEATVLTFPVELPTGVTNLSGWEEVEVAVRFPELLAKTFTVTNITPVNVPEGMEAEIVTQTLQVTVRGPKEMMEKMQETDISVTVDFSGAQLGTFTMKCSVVMGTGYSDAGAMGSYNVSATLREAEDNT